MAVVNSTIASVFGVAIFKRPHSLRAPPVIRVFGKLSSITVSFLTQRTVMFRRRGPWLRAYLHCYAVYGATTIATTRVQGGPVDRLDPSIGWAQARVVPLGVPLSYHGPARFTFAPGAARP